MCPPTQPAFFIPAHALSWAHTKGPRAHLGARGATAGTRARRGPAGRATGRHAGAPQVVEKGGVRGNPSAAGRGGAREVGGGSLTARPGSRSARDRGAEARGVSRSRTRARLRRHALGLLRQREPLGRLPGGPGRPQQRLLRGRAQRGAACLLALHHFPHPLHR